MKYLSHQTQPKPCCCFPLNWGFDFQFSLVFSNFLSLDFLSTFQREKLSWPPLEREYTSFLFKVKGQLQEFSLKSQGFSFHTLYDHTRLHHRFYLDSLLFSLSEVLSLVSCLVGKKINDRKKKLSDEFERTVVQFRSRRIG